MISRLPRWVWAVASAMAFIAGIVNVVGLLGFEHETLTHLTGNTSRLAASLASLDFRSTVHMLALLGSFVAGTVISGFVIQDVSLQLDRRYSVALSLESALLFVSVPLLHSHSGWGLYAAACACGIQNAMISTYSGAVVRTTHLSGMFTDLGISLGHFMRGLPVERKRLWLCFAVISGFLAGGICGTLLFSAVTYYALLLPAVLTAAAATGYAIYRTRQKALQRVVL